MLVEPQRDAAPTSGSGSYDSDTVVQNKKIIKWPNRFLHLTFVFPVVNQEEL
jgi:hypothetical protein